LNEAIEDLNEAASILESNNANIEGKKENSKQLYVIHTTLA